jgi:hypothetical protein
MKKLPRGISIERIGKYSIGVNAFQNIGKFDAPGILATYKTTGIT